MRGKERRMEERSKEKDEGAERGKNGQKGKVCRGQLPLVQKEGSCAGVNDKQGGRKWLVGADVRERSKEGSRERKKEKVCGM